MSSKDLIDPRFWRKLWNGEKISLFGDDDEGEENVIEVIEEEE